MKPFIIAEMSANHNGSLERAFGIIEAASFAGADAIKFQTFDPEQMAVPGYTIPDGAWQGMDLVDLYKQAQTPYEWHEELFRHARELDLIPMSSPFDALDVDFLENFNCPIYKIASYEMVDLRLITRAAETGKPLIMSTGMASHDEILDAVVTAEEAGCQDITLLHCVSEYPAPTSNINLHTMKDLEGFAWKVGLSDHTLGTSVSVAAVALGATVIEKHITLSKTGLDAGFSLDPGEFHKLVEDCNTAAEALGRVRYGKGDSSLRRSLYYAQDIKAGTKIDHHHIKTARPALGMHPSKLNTLIGKTLARDVKENDPV